MNWVAMVFYFCFLVFRVPLGGIFKCGTQRCLINRKEQRNGKGPKKKLRLRERQRVMARLALCVYFVSRVAVGEVFQWGFD